MREEKDAYPNEEHNAVDCFCDKLMQDIIEVIDTLNRLETRRLGIRANTVTPDADVSDLLLQKYNKNMHNLRESYRKYRELTQRPQNPAFPLSRSSGFEL